MTERSKTVDGAIAVLAALARDGPGSATDLAARTGLNRTALYRLLGSLEAGHLVLRGPDGAWKLGAGLLELAARVERDLRRAARPLLEQLASDFGETAVLSIPDGDDVIAVDQAVGERHPVRVDYPPGFRHRQTRGAHGRVVLAHARPDAIERVLAVEDEPARLRTELEATRDAGYATTHNELQFGASGTAVPVFVHGTVVASVGVIAPVGRLPADELLVPALQKAAGELETRLTQQLDQQAPTSMPGPMSGPMPGPMSGPIPGPMPGRTRR